MTSRIFILVLLCVISSAQVSAQEELFPFLGQVTDKSVNIRAGQSTNFESLGQVKKGEQIVVVDKSYSWYKILLPIHLKSYISNEFVHPINAKVGRIDTNRLNVRAGAGINYSVLGQLNSGDHVAILEHLDGWYKIQPVEESYGWISDKFVEFVSIDVSGYVTPKVEIPLVVEVEEPEVPEVEVAAVLVQPEVEIQPELPPANNAEAEAPPTKINEEFISPVTEKTEPEVNMPTTFKGVLTLSADGENEEFKYVLTNTRSQPYYLDGFSQLLNPFLNYRVRIEGYIKDVEASAYKYPIVVVKKIQLIL